MTAVDNLPGKPLTVYLLATLLAAGAVAWAWLVHRYRAALPALMRAPLDAAAPSETTPAQWRRAAWRLVCGLLTLSALIALTHGAITQWLSAEGPWSWPRFLLFSALLAWPALPAIALLQRWPRAWLVAALLAWYAAACALAMLRSNEAQSGLMVAYWLAFEMGPPSLALLLFLLAVSALAWWPVWRFARRTADVPQRLAAFDWQPDAKRRWRVNECYGHDSSWQAALAGRFAWIELPADRQLERREVARRVLAAMAQTGDHGVRAAAHTALVS